MFTGLIETLGEVTAVVRGDKSLRITVAPRMSGFTALIGDSIAINGACLTVDAILGTRFSFTAVYESLEKTTLGSLKSGEIVNMERALLATSRLDGHIVQGHIDGVGEIIADRPCGDGLYRTIRIPSPLMAFMPVKGSLAVDGISLTIADNSSDSVTVSLIPHSVEKTTMAFKKAGAKVNIECDVLARYIHQMLLHGGGRVVPLAGEPIATGKTSESLLSLMERSGF